MENYFEKVLNNDLNYYIFKLLHKTLLNEVFDELFGKIKYIDVLQEIVENHDCNYYITFKRGRFVSTIFYPIYSNGTGWLVYFS